MFKNYLKIAARNLSGQKFFSLINISGLAIGLACTMLILLYVQHELSFDNHHSKADRIYRVQCQIQFGEKFFDMNTNPAPLGAALSDDYPEVEATVRLKDQGRYLVKIGEVTFQEEGLVFADSSIFTVFDIPLIKGTKEALYKPNSIVIDENTAKKYFADANPIGERLLLDNKIDVEITGVFATMPTNSHFHYTHILSMSSLDYSKDTNWLSNNFYTYAVLQDGTTQADLESKFPQMIEKYVGPQVNQFLNLSMEDFASSGNFIKYNLLPIKDIHLYSQKEDEIEANGNIVYVYLFTGIAFLVLVLAAINFMNLSTARSAGRAKEVGVRKVLGSLRSHLIYQFLTESIIISAVAMLIAILLAQLAVPYFNDLANTTMGIPYTSPLFYALILSGVLGIGMIAGVYPAFFLSAFRPATVLKGKLNLGVKSGWLRSTLVVFQFAISTILIVTTMVINKQLDFIMTTNLGFNKERVLLVEDAYGLGDQIQSFKSKVKQIAGVSNATVSGYLPIGSNRSDNMYWREGQTPNEETMVSTQQWRVDYDYIETLGMDLLDGRNFIESNGADSSAIIINEEAAKLFGIADDPLGAHIVTWEDMPDENGNAPLEVKTVIGVVRNFHFSSLKENIGPLFLRLGKSSYYLSVRVEDTDMPTMIDNIEAEWVALANGQPFAYSFMDQRYDDMYNAESRVRNLFSVFAVLAILIACLGLFGLAAFTAQQRTKEIGVRKVMGASVPGIVMLLSKEFGKLIIIAMTISFPLAWYGISEWLQDYKFRIELTPWIFIMAGLITFLIAWLTMSYQSIKAATMSPSKSLRDE